MTKEFFEGAPFRIIKHTDLLMRFQSDSHCSLHLFPAHPDLPFLSFLQVLRFSDHNANVSNVGSTVSQIALINEG